MTAPMLLFFAPSRERGGCEEYFIHMVRMAASRGFRVVTVLPRLPGTESVWEELAPIASVQHGWIPVERASVGWSTFDEQREAARDLLRALAPAAVWCALPWIDSALGFIAACAELSVPGLCVWQLATEEIAIPAAHSDACVASQRTGLVWVAVSSNNRNFLARSFRTPSESISVIYDGLLDAGRFDASEGARQTARSSVRAELCVSESTRLVITVARLCFEHKAQDIFVQALDQVLPIPNTHFLWVGDGEDADAVRHMLREHGLSSGVHLLGRRSDVPRLLLASDLFVLPSREEGFPFAVLEAMATMCPVLVSSTGGLPEVFTDEVDCLFVPPSDAASLARGLRRALHQPHLCHRLAESAYRKVTHQLGSSMVTQSFALLANCLKGRASDSSLTGRWR